MVADQAELDQLERAVDRQPGSRAYALLAQRYLDAGRTERGLEVCEAGFAANPSFERGAVMYLRLLRESGRLERADQVYRIAIEANPGSSTIRIAWARALVDQGRTDEARRAAHDALEIDAYDQDARQLLVGLGDPVPLVATAAGTHEYAARPDDAPGSGRRSSSPGEVRGDSEVRRLGERTSATSLFDFSAPVPMEPSAEHDRRRFDATPMPLSSPSPPRPVRVDRPPDGPTGPPYRPGRTGPEPAPRGITGPTQTPRGGAGRAPGAAPRAADRPRLADLLDGGDRGAKGRQRSVAFRRALIAAIALLCLAMATVAVLLYRSQRDRVLVREAAAALALADGDTVDGYRRAAEGLQALLLEHPNDVRLHARLALIEAHLATRFGIGEPAAVAARVGRGAGQPWADLARGLLRIHAGDVEASAAALATSAVGVGTWHRRLLELELAVTRGEGKIAEAVAQREMKLRPPAPAVLARAARFQRLAGRLSEAEALIEAGPAIVGAPLELQIEAALLDAQRGVRPRSGVGPDTLEPKVTAVAAPRLAAASKLVRALGLANQRQTRRARELALQARKLDPDNQEAAWLAAIWQLAPGGSVVAGLDDITAAATTMSRLRPAAGLWLVEALLRAGRPHEARARLVQVPARRLSPAERAWREALEARCADRTDDTSTLARVCGAPRSEALLVACAEAYFDREADEAIAIVRRAKGTSVARYLRALQALSRGRHARAASALRAVYRQRVRADGHAVHRWPMVTPLDVGAPLLGVARAHQQLNQLEQAVEVLRRAVEADAGSLRSRVALASALVAAGHDSEARTLLEALLDERATDPQLIAIAGQAFLDLGNAKQARQLLRAAGQRALDAPALRLLAGRVAQAEGRSDEARRIFAAALEHDPKSAAALVELGRIEADAGETAAARRRFARALELRPKDPDLLLLLAKAYAAGGRHRAALRPGLRAINLFNRADRPWRAREAMLELGRLLGKGDRWARARALELLQEASKGRDAPAIVLLELGRLHRRGGQRQRAIDAFTRAIARDRNLAAAYRDLALLYRSSRRTRAKADPLLRQYLTLRPNAPDAGRIRALIGRRR